MGIPVNSLFLIPPRESMPCGPRSALLERATLRATVLWVSAGHVEGHYSLGPCGPRRGPLFFGPMRATLRATMRSMRATSKAMRATRFHPLGMLPGGHATGFNNLFPCITQPLFRVLATRPQFVDVDFNEFVFFRFS